MVTFAALRDVPQTGLSEWEYALLGGMKENLELLVGARQAGVRAVMSSSIAVSQLGNQQMMQTSATGAYYTLSGVNVPTHTDYLILKQDLQTLANDLASTRTAFDTLVSQLKA